MLDSSKQLIHCFRMDGRIDKVSGKTVGMSWKDHSSQWPHSPFWTVLASVECALSCTGQLC